MVQRELGHLRVLREQLDLHVGEEMRKQILPDGETIGSSAKQVKKAEWAQRVMARMDTLLDEPTRIRIRHGCACNVSAKQKQLAKQYRKEYPNLDDYLRALDVTKQFGRIRREGNTLYVEYGWGRCLCGVVEKTTEPVSRTFCECCNGHMHKLYEVVLNHPVTVEMVETISTGGEECRFIVHMEG